MGVNCRYKLEAKVKELEAANQKQFRQLIRTELQRDGYRKVDTDIAVKELEAENERLRACWLTLQMLSADKAEIVWETAREYSQDRTAITSCEKSAMKRHNIWQEVNKMTYAALTPKEKP